MASPIASRLNGTSIVRSPDIRGVVHLIDDGRVLCGTPIEIVHDEAVVAPFNLHCNLCLHALRESEGEARPGTAS